MDRVENKPNRWAWLRQEMPGVSKLIAEKRTEVGKEWVDECWKRGVLQAEPGWFFAGEGAVMVGTMWDEPVIIAFASARVTRTQALLIMRPPVHCSACGKRMTGDEVHHLGTSCEACERKAYGNGAH